MTPHTLNILLGLSTVGFVVVSLLYSQLLTFQPIDGGSKS